MTENKKLAYFSLTLLGISAFLVAGVIAHDRGLDQAFIDHLCDFHVNSDAIHQEVDRIEKDKQKALEREERIREWCEDIRSFGREEKGIDKPSDRDK